MPVIPGNQAYSLTGQQIANQLKANPEFYNVLGGAAGYTTEPMLTVCNEVMSRILDENMPWKWNRKVIPPFLTVSLQQDYVSNITDIGWLEDAWRIDINNSTSNNNGAPKPTFVVETVRDIPQVSAQSTPQQICFIPNSYAIMGSWQPNTAYSCGYGVSMTPRSPIQQFIDENGNILFIDSTQLGLTIEAPGYTGTAITPPGFYPYGVSGSVQPSAPPNATPGTLVQDNTVIWTVADAINGYAMRLSPCPALNGLCWWIVPRYQVLPPTVFTLQQPLDPIPMSMMFLFRAGCRAMLKQFNGSKDADKSYMEWEEQLMKSLRGADRQQEEFSMIPTVSPMGSSGGWSANWSGIGAAWPFGGGPFGQS
jgi:hypothetical protein